jgi:hypothetical protein
VDDRRIGAVAGLAPPALVVGWYLVAGGPAHPALLSFFLVGVIAGWLVGPRAKGSIPRQLVAMTWYFVVAYAM